VAGRRSLGQRGRMGEGGAGAGALVRPWAVAHPGVPADGDGSRRVPVAGIVGRDSRLPIEMRRRSGEGVRVRRVRVRGCTAARRPFIRW
jgi:hypothetical protein